MKKVKAPEPGQGGNGGRISVILIVIDNNTSNNTLIKIRFDRHLDHKVYKRPCDFGCIIFSFS